MSCFVVRNNIIVDAAPLMCTYRMLLGCCLFDALSCTGAGRGGRGDIRRNGATIPGMGKVRTEVET